MHDTAGMGDVLVQATGTRLFLDCKDILTGATTTEIHGRKPDGTAFVWPAQADGTGVYYLTQAGDIDQHGRWTLQSYVVLPDWSGHGDVEVMIAKM